MNASPPGHAIDGSAHRSAPAAHGRTVCIVGTGIRHAYPEEHRRLHSLVAVAGSALSQFRPDTRPQCSTFPAPDATMVGYEAATVIVEASERSGARIQVREAVGPGRSVLPMRPVLDRAAWTRPFLRRPDVHAVQDMDNVLRTLGRIIDHPRERLRPYGSWAGA
ncbi:DNA-processing protein DprA [Streptomyces sp. NPDC058961]|uniref:DNA-processing protein DprA n=1 Tax=Streptomyces sp. NPDC058961 TaxID=3346680 RepID=UPI0036BD9200